MLTTATIQKYGNDMFVSILLCIVQTFIRYFQQEVVASLDTGLEYLFLCEGSCACTVD